MNLPTRKSGVNPQRITIIALGSEGDVRPFVALGVGLKQQGYSVLIATNTEFEGLVKERDLEFYKISGEAKKSVTELMNFINKKGQNPLEIPKVSNRVMRMMAPQWAREAISACEDADLIIGGGSAATPAPYIAASVVEKLHKPFVQAYPSPTMLATNFRFGAIPGFLNSFLHHFLMVMFWKGIEAMINDGRKDLGLSKYPGRGPQYQLRKQPMLFSFSPLVVPSENIPQNIKVTGYWFLDDKNWKPSKELVDFFSHSERPIYIGFGSMPNEDAKQTTQIVVEALKRLNKRAIVATDWGGLDSETLKKELKENVLIVDHVSHDWLFPQVSLAIHHAGAGTTAATLKAGIPSVAVPFFGDQPFWAWRLEELGVAPKSIAKKNLTSENLANAITQALSEPFQAKAQEVGKLIHKEDGVKRAIKILKDWKILPTL